MKSKIEGVCIRPSKINKDKRGHLCELWRHDNLHNEHYPVMSYVTQTLPGVVRGPHQHRLQTDMFSFVGPGDFLLHLWERRWPDVQAMKDGKLPEAMIYHEKFLVGEANPATVIVPPGIIHAYKCISSEPGYVINSPNVLYGGPGSLYEVDEIRHEDQENSPFIVE